MKGGIFIVIYVDILFIINFFITFLLVSLTARLTKRRVKTARLVFASAFGGIYSLIILVSIPFYISLMLKVLSAAVIIFIAFGGMRLKSFALCVFVFLFSSFVFLGIITGALMLFKSERIAVSNSTPYFNIGARGLLISAFFAYVISCAVVRLYNKKVSAGEIYTLKIERQGQSVTLFALADTGNKLREPFSGSGVIVASREKVKPLSKNSALRVIPASTVSGSAYLEAFMPDRVIIKCKNKTETALSVYVAMSGDMDNSEYSAVFNPEIISV